MIPRRLGLHVIDLGCIASAFSTLVYGLSEIMEFNKKNWKFNWQQRLKIWTGFVWCLMQWVVGPKDLPRIARMAGRLTGRSIGYVQLARGQFDNVMQQSQARQVLVLKNHLIRDCELCFIVHNMLWQCAQLVKWLKLRFLLYELLGSKRTSRCTCTIRFDSLWSSKSIAYKPRSYDSKADGQSWRTRPST